MRLIKGAHVLLEQERPWSAALTIPHDKVRVSFAVPGGEGSTISARRETVFTHGPRGMLSVAGGKLTTYRRIALRALGELRRELGLHRFDRRPWPLPGAAGLDRVAFPTELPPPGRSHLLQLYGSLVDEVLAPAAEDVLRRRTTLALRGLATEQIRTDVEDLLEAGGARLLP